MSVQIELKFHGTDYDTSLDRDRLTSQFDNVVSLAHGERWWSLKELSLELNYLDASISRQLRYASKRGYLLEKKHEGNGLYLYRLKFITMFEEK